MRVKRGVTSHRRHQKIRRATKGMTRSNRSSIKRGKQAVTKALQFAYRD
ncbi:MAG TPA: 50S ribosomal protein L20, partial [Patescibacteria group bacterium]|nr:50S ribosomal protein L20 [Patescibacteria group bacterium]